MIRRRHLKPRVRLTRTWRGEEEYVCAGNGCGGSGQTPPGGHPQLAPGNGP
jgi:hypothetical protein